VGDMGHQHRYLVDSNLDEKLNTLRTPDRQLCSKASAEGVATPTPCSLPEVNQELFGGPRWKALAAKCAQTQRLLWGRTSTKNPSIAMCVRRRTDRRRHCPTRFRQTFDAFSDHGKLPPHPYRKR